MVRNNSTMPDATDADRVFYYVARCDSGAVLPKLMVSSTPASVTIPALNAMPVLNAIKCYPIPIAALTSTKPLAFSRAKGKINNLMYHMGDSFELNGNCETKDREKDALKSFGSAECSGSGMLTGVLNANIDIRTKWNKPSLLNYAFESTVARRACNAGSQQPQHSAPHSLQLLAILVDRIIMIWGEIDTLLESSADADDQGEMHVVCHSSLPGAVDIEWFNDASVSVSAPPMQSFLVCATAQHLVLMKVALLENSSASDKQQTMHLAMQTVCIVMPMLSASLCTAAITAAGLQPSAMWSDSATRLLSPASLNTLHSIDNTHLTIVRIHFIPRQRCFLVVMSLVGPSSTAVPVGASNENGTYMFVGLLKVPEVINMQSQASLQTPFEALVWVPSPEEQHQFLTSHSENANHTHQLFQLYVRLQVTQYVYPALALPQMPPSFASQDNSAAIAVNITEPKKTNPSAATSPFSAFQALTTAAAMLGNSKSKSVIKDITLNNSSLNSTDIGPSEVESDELVCGVQNTLDRVHRLVTTLYHMSPLAKVPFEQYVDPTAAMVKTRADGIYVKNFDMSVHSLVKSTSELSQLLHEIRCKVDPVIHSNVCNTNWEVANSCFWTSRLPQRVLNECNNAQQVGWLVNELEETAPYVLTTPTPVDHQISPHKTLNDKRMSNPNSGRNPSSTYEFSGNQLRSVNEPKERASKPLQIQARLELPTGLKILSYACSAAIGDESLAASPNVGGTYICCVCGPSSDAALNSSGAPGIYIFKIANGFSHPKTSSAMTLGALRTAVQHAHLPQRIHPFLAIASSSPTPTLYRQLEYQRSLIHACLQRLQVSLPNTLQTAADSVASSCLQQQIARTVVDEHMLNPSSIDDVSSDVPYVRYVTASQSRLASLSSQMHERLDALLDDQASFIGWVRTADGTAGENTQTLQSSVNVDKAIPCSQPLSYDAVLPLVQHIPANIQPFTVSPYALQMHQRQRKSVTAQLQKFSTSIISSERHVTRGTEPQTVFPSHLEKTCKVGVPTIPCIQTFSSSDFEVIKSPREVLLPSTAPPATRAPVKHVQPVAPVTVVETPAATRIVSAPEVSTASLNTSKQISVAVPTSQPIADKIITFRDRIQEFYQKHCPAELSKVDALCAKYSDASQHDKVLARLHAKYNVPYDAPTSQVAVTSGLLVGNTTLNAVEQPTAMNELNQKIQSKRFITEHYIQSCSPSMPSNPTSIFIGPNVNHPDIQRVIEFYRSTGPAGVSQLTSHVPELMKKALNGNTAYDAELKEIANNLLKMTPAATQAPVNVISSAAVPIPQGSLVISTTAAAPVLGSTAPPPSDRDRIVAEITQIYNQFAPDKLTALPKNLKEYEGREGLMLEKIRKKYGITTALQPVASTAPVQAPSLFGNNGGSSGGNTPSSLFSKSSAASSVFANSTSGARSPSFSGFASSDIGTAAGARSTMGTSWSTTSVAASGLHSPQTLDISKSNSTSFMTAANPSTSTGSGSLFGMGTGSGLGGGFNVKPIQASGATIGGTVTPKSLFGTQSVQPMQPMSGVGGSSLFGSGSIVSPTSNAFQQQPSSLFGKPTFSTSAYPGMTAASASPSLFGAGGGFGSTAPPPSDRDRIVAEITQIYNQFAPDKLTALPKNLKEYEGREGLMLEKIRKKYGITTALQPVASTAPVQAPSLFGNNGGTSGGNTPSSLFGRSSSGGTTSFGGFQQQQPTSTLANRGSLFGNYR